VGRSGRGRGASFRVNGSRSPPVPLRSPPSLAVTISTEHMCMPRCFATVVPLWQGQAPGHYSSIEIIEVCNLRWLRNAAVQALRGEAWQCCPCRRDLGMVHLCVFVRGCDVLACARRRPTLTRLRCASTRDGASVVIDTLTWACSTADGRLLGRIGDSCHAHGPAAIVMRSAQATRRTRCVRACFHACMRTGASLLLLICAMHRTLSHPQVGTASMRTNQALTCHC
jgi:hypothetical protein